MAKVDVHQHDLRSQGLRVRLFPGAAPPPADLDGRVLQHKLLAIGHWNDDTESNLFSFADLQVSTRAESVIHTKLDLLGSWELPGAATDIQVADIGAGEVLLTIATSTGSVVLGRLLIPRTPGTTPDEMQILELPAEEGRLQAWAEPHKGPVASVDVHPDSKAVLTVGADGRVVVMDPGAGDSPTTAPFASSPAGCTSYTNGRWADTAVFVTASSLGGLDTWDTRAGPRPVARSPTEWGPVGARSCLAPSTSAPSTSTASSLLPDRCTWLHVHPSRPNLCASGSSCGTVAVWDLRFNSRPMAWSTGSGCVWEVRFDTASSSAASSSGACPPLLFASDEGVLGSTGSSASQLGRPLLQLPSCVNSFDVEGSMGRSVVAVTESQQVLYVHRGA